MAYYDPDFVDIRTLESALTSCQGEELRRIAGLTGGKVPTRKADMALLVVRHLEGDGLRRVWEQLDELQQAAVAEAVHCGAGTFDARRFRAKYGADPDWGSRDSYGYLKGPSLLHLFFFRGSMPADVKARLKTFVPRPRPFTITVAEQLPAFYERPSVDWGERAKGGVKRTERVPMAARETERAAQRELLSVLRLVDAGKVAVSAKTHRASASTVVAVGAVLEGDDYYPYVPAEDEWEDDNAGPIRAFAWPLLIQAGGLAQLSGTRLQLTRAGRKALSEPPADTIYKLWQKWLQTTMLDELARIDCVKGQTGKGKRGLTAVASRRESISRSLAACPAGMWIQTDEFLRSMTATGNAVMVSRDPWSLYISDPNYGSVGFDGSVEVLDTRYVLALLLEYAATLGILDVALIPPARARTDYHDLWGADDLPFFSRYDGLMYFRITALGAWCLGIASRYEPPPVEAKTVVRVLPNLEIAAAGAELEVSDRLALDAFAIRVSEFVWRIEAGKLLAAIEEGRPLEEFREYLTARSGAPVPDTVLRLLEDVTERSFKVHDRGIARLLECADAALAALIANDSRTRKYCLRAGERHLVVPGASEAAFRRALRDGGYLVAAAETGQRVAKA